jgi:hypothetical protein
MGHARARLRCDGHRGEAGDRDEHTPARMIDSASGMADRRSGMGLHLKNRSIRNKG